MKSNILDQPLLSVFIRYEQYSFVFNQPINPSYSIKYDGLIGEKWSGREFLGFPDSFEHIFYAKKDPFQHCGKTYCTVLFVAQIGIKEPKLSTVCFTS